VRAAKLAMAEEALLPQEKDQTMAYSCRQTEVIGVMASEKQLWDELYNQYQTELVCYLQGKWHKTPEDARDIVQQTFERFMTVAEPRAIEQPRAYLYQLVRNLVVDGLRRDTVRAEHARREALSEEPTGADAPLQSVLGGEQLQALQRIIEKLPAKRRRAFVLSRVHQMSYREIAEVMGISTDGVKKHVLRAMETCQAHLMNRFEE